MANIASPLKEKAFEKIRFSIVQIDEIRKRIIEEVEMNEEKFGSELLAYKLAYVFGLGVKIATLQSEIKYINENNLTNGQYELFISQMDNTIDDIKKQKIKYDELKKDMILLRLDLEFAEMIEQFKGDQGPPVQHLIDKFKESDLPPIFRPMRKNSKVGEFLRDAKK